MLKKKVNYFRFFFFFRCHLAGRLDVDFRQEDTMPRNHEDVHDPCTVANIDHHNRK